METLLRGLYSTADWRWPEQPARDLNPAYPPGINPTGAKSGEKEAALRPPQKGIYYD